MDLTHQREEDLPVDVDWGELIVGQLEFYWEVHLRPRLDGLTDEEYFWEPAPGCWTVRPDGAGRWTIDGGRPEPVPPPFTTIAWRMVHIATNMASRTSAFFDGPDLPMFDPRHVSAELPGTAVEGIGFLAAAYTNWRDRIAGLDPDALRAPLGRKGGPFADDPMAALIVHVNREVMHHGGEIGALRDMYRIFRPVETSR
jgi:hypothetical protein